MERLVRPVYASNSGGQSDLGSEYHRPSTQCIAPHPADRHRPLAKDMAKSMKGVSGESPRSATQTIRTTRPRPLRRQTAEMEFTGP